MFRYSIAALMFAFVAFPAVSQERPSAPQADLSKAIRDAKMVEPFKVFDNLYYVGMDWVSAWLIPTSTGLILIDSLYGEFTDKMLENIKKLGFDPKNIKYCFVTHGHFDHMAGVKKVKDVSGARIATTDEDWTMFVSGQGGGKYETIPKDLVMKDGDTVTLGDTKLNFYITPGHTPGVLTMKFTVYDNGAPHTAFVLGGAGLNFSGVERCEMFIKSLERVKAMKGIEVNVANHPPMGQVFERRDRLAARKSGDPHPFVAPDDFYKWIDTLLYDANRKLRMEKQRTQH